MGKSKKKTALQPVVHRHRQWPEPTTLAIFILLLAGLQGCAWISQTGTEGESRVTESTYPFVEGEGNRTEGESSETEADTDSESSFQGDGIGKVSWNGKTYEYNDHLSNFLFIGVDKEELVESTPGSRDAGKADALFLVSWDRVSNDITVITIPRDTMATFNVYDRDGTDLGPVEQHICLAYSYGDGKHESCRMTKEAVSKLFYRIPIQGYCAVTMDALPEIASAMGPVTVTVPNDSLTDRVPEMYEGAQVTITEDNIEMFVRYRDITVENTALYRQERQNAYLEACYEKVLAEYPNDAGIVTDLYEALTPYMVTGMGNDQFVKLMESAVAGGSLTRWTVPGEGVSTQVFDEYHIDEDAFYEQILNSFFEEVQ